MLTIEKHPPVPSTLFGGDHVGAARRTSTAAGLACLGMVAAIALAGCGGGNASDPVKRAEAQVSQKQKALDEAKASFEKASTTACTSVTSYVVAVDRYGDVIHQTAVTVGDVRDAGKDLAAPRADAMSSAEAAAAAHQEVVKAQNELTDAQAVLKQAQAQAQNQTQGGSTGAPTTPAPASASATPLAPAATVDRVKAADADFTTAQKGITDKTPLAQASQEFNAAAVSLELAWLRLLADAGCLTDAQQQQAETAVREYTTALQKSLAEAGYYDGKIDGVYGPTTLGAVEALQKAHSLPITGWVDKATAAALQAELQKVGGAAAGDAIATTAAVQQSLKLAGYWDGPVDGSWTPELTDAVKEFQKALGVKVTGEVDAATIAAFEKAIAQAQKALTASPSPTPSAVASPTSPSPTGSPTG